MDETSINDWRSLEITTRSTAELRDVAELRVPGLTVLAHPDVRRVGERAALPALVSGREVGLSRLEPLFAAPDGSRRRPLADPHLSRRPLILAPAPEAGVSLLTGGSKIRLSVDGEAVREDRHVTAAQIERGVVLLLAKRIAVLLHTLHPSPPLGVPRFGLVGDSAEVLSLRQQIARVADLEVPVLLRGATGTGKELVAAAIHRTSARSTQPFVGVNMGALPSTLAAAELFGTARGAFTGAHRRRSGYFSRAHRGTLFLDELGETPPEVQVLLLRTLETGIVQPLGSETSQEVDVRIVAATDSQLESEIAKGRFRAPLLHRLAGYEIRLPPLSQRRDDLGRLLFHFVRQELESLGEAWRLDATDPPWLPAPLVARLATLPWPGNVRQLRNVARQLVIGNRGTSQARIMPEIAGMSEAGADRPEIVESRSAAARPAPAPEPRPSYRAPGDVDEEELSAALRAHGFRLQPTAAALGISRTSLYVLVDKSPRIRKARDLSREEIEGCRQRNGDDLDAMAAELEVSRKGLRIRMTQLGLP